MMIPMLDIQNKLCECIYVSHIPAHAILPLPVPVP